MTVLDNSKTDEQGREPERPTTRVLKAKSFGGRPVTADVIRLAKRRPPKNPIDVAMLKL